MKIVQLVEMLEDEAPPPPLFKEEVASPPPRRFREPLSPPPPPQRPLSSPPPPPQRPHSPPPPPPQRPIPVGLVVGAVVGAVAILVALVVFLVRRRRPRLGEEGSTTINLLHLHRPSEAPLGAESGGQDEVPLPKGMGEVTNVGNITPREAPNSQELVQLPDSYKIQSNTSGSSSVSTADNAQSPLVLVGLRTFEYKELSEATSHFSQDKFLGQGGFGSVYRGVVAGGGVAIKQLQIGSFQGEREFLTEINVISRVHHRNLVSLVGYCVSGSERLLVYEFVENNLAFHLQGTGTPLLDWPTRMSIALGAAKGIAYLHEECHPRIIHRDIKSTNILLDSNFRAKVADFGLAKFVPDDKTHVTTRIMGTFGYLAPEFGSSGRLTEKSDVFSFGIVLLELITGRQPINLVEWASPFLDQALEDGVIETELIDPKLESNYDYEEMNQMVTCAAISVHRFPDHRPKMSQVVQVLEGNISPEKLKAQTSKPRSHRHRPN